jgi:hypothetical protein
MARGSIVLALGAALTAALLVWLLFREGSSPRRDDGSAVNDDFAARLNALESRLAALERESAFADTAAPGSRPSDPALPREPVVKPHARPASSGDRPALDARWFLERYVAAHEQGSGGTEYFRLGVEAYAIELLDELAALLLDTARPLALRSELVRMLSHPRFRGNSSVIETLLAGLRASSSELADRLVQGLKQVGTESTAGAIAEFIWSLPRTVQVSALDAIARLSGARCNETMARLLRSAPSDELKKAILNYLDNRDPAAALDAFRYLSGDPSQAARLAAAQRIGAFRDEPIRSLVVEWLGFERDPDVRRALGAAQQKSSQPADWSAKKAVGPPDVDNPAMDHVNAWASAQADMGEQWLEVAFANPVKASQVRIFEVCSAGAVVAIHAIEPSGTSHVVWSGDDPLGSPGVFEAGFPLTAYLVKRVRIVLDTNRTKGWNEIDAVELVGPAGGQWAADAAASSTYGAQ